MQRGRGRKWCDVNPICIYCFISVVLEHDLGLPRAGDPSAFPASTLRTAVSRICSPRYLNTLLNTVVRFIDLFMSVLDGPSQSTRLPTAGSTHGYAERRSGIPGSTRPRGVCELDIFQAEISLKHCKAAFQLRRKLEARHFPGRQYPYTLRGCLPAAPQH